MPKKNNNKKTNKTKVKTRLSSIEKKINKVEKFKLYELVLMAVAIFAVSAFITSAFTIGYMNSRSLAGTANLKKNDLSEFQEVYSLITSSYYKKVDKSKLIDGAIDGMLSSLGDPHTSYMSKVQTDNFNEVMNGSFEGIGVEISSDKDQNIVVISVFKNSPASEEGMKFNDKIIEVNGKSTKGLTTNDVVALIKNKEKPVAEVKVDRSGKEITFSMKKRIVEIESVESEVFNHSGKKIGYILVNNFANNTYDQFKSNLEELESKNISGLIIDVRGNSGGYLHSVTNMLDILLPKGVVKYQIEDKKGATKYYSESNVSRNYPIAVLVDKSSASASEILAISLKESYGADVVGTYTYGKGTVQITKNLTSGGMIKYTTQKWLSPKGNWINEKGVEPTISVEMNEEYFQNYDRKNDNQLQAALEAVVNHK